MKICIISGYKNKPDEGVKNFVANIGRELSNNNEILYLNVRESLLNLQSWKILKQFNPDIVHIFLRFNFSTFFISKILRNYCNNANFVFSGLQPPELFPFSKFFIKPLISDIVLVQSIATEIKYKSMGYKTFFLPSGVDLNKFKIADEFRKRALRIKYGLSPDSYIILHVGHINKGRNLEILGEMTKFDDYQVLIIGSTNEFNFDQNVFNYLQQAGCVLKREYLENIEDFYQLSDCYVFPTLNPSYAIEIPLSVLEAMACGIPVLSTKFGGLTRIFSEGEGIFYSDTPDEFIDKIKLIKNAQDHKINRDNINQYSWENVSKYIEEIYKTSINNGELKSWKKNSYVY